MVQIGKVILVEKRAPKTRYWLISYIHISSYSHWLHPISKLSLSSRWEDKQVICMATALRVRITYMNGGVSFTHSILLVWLTKDRLSPGPVFGSKDNFNGLGIFFDTYDNERAHVCTMLIWDRIMQQDPHITNLISASHVPLYLSNVGRWFQVIRQWQGW